MTSQRSDQNEQREPSFWRRTVGVPILCAVVASLMTAAMFQGRVNILPENISYTDLAAVVLTAVTIILAVVALAVGALAIIGWRAFMKMAEATAKKAAVPAATSAIETYVATSAEELLVQRAETVALRVITKERLDQLLRERIDILLVGNPADEELDKQEIAEEALEEEQEDEQ